MRERAGTKLSVLVCAAVMIGCAFDAAPASAVLISHFQPIGSYSDARGDLPVRSGTLVQAHYGPFTVPANGQIHNQIDQVQAPCSNCFITDMVPSLLNGTSTAPGTTVQNLNTDAMMHHFVLINNTGDRADSTCPIVGPGLLGERFFAAGNERTHMHLPNGYGYPHTSNPWYLITHLVNKSASPKTFWLEVTIRYASVASPVRPIWLDIDGMTSTENGTASCGDSEYTIPTGASDSHKTWQVPATVGNGRIVAMSGHMHDVDITGPGSCTDHCASAGHGLSMTAELVGGSGSVYHGPNPPTVPCDEPDPGDDRCSTIPHPTGATVCRSEGYYGTAFGGTAFRGHLDTVSLCGDYGSVPPGAQALAYPAGSAYSGDGFQISAGQQIRLHSEYQNNTGSQQTDAMGIMVGYMTPLGYPRAKAATPTYVPLVHAYQACGAPNRVHATPLNFPSCNPPQRTSSLLTSGTPDSNSRVANFSGSVKFVVPAAVAGPPDDADVNITVNVADVRKTDAGLTDYTGELELRPTLRITDRNNTPGERGTTQSIDFPVAVPCTATADANIGSSCSISTSADAVQPGSVIEDRRASWEFERVRVFDGGADGDANTLPNNLFAVQGVFVP